MKNHYKTSESTFNFDELSDLEVVMDIINKYYCIADSTLIKFQRKAKERLSSKAEDANNTITNGVAKKLLRASIDRYC